MKTRTIVLTVLVLALIAGATWMARQRGLGPGKPAAGAAASTAAQAIELAPGDVARAETLPLNQQLALTGTLKAVQSAVVKARVAAEVQSLTVREGDRVSAGQLLGRLNATEFQLRLRQAREQAAAAQAQLDIAQRAQDNNQALVNQGFISRNALDTAVSNRASAQATLQAALAAADLAQKAVADSEIRAPIAGLVASRLVQPGERVPVDTRLVEIVDLSRIELEAAVAPEDVLALRVGQTARVQLDGLSEALPARVVRIAPSAQTGSRSVLAYLAVSPHEGLRQGLFAKAQVEVDRRTALVVPVSALRLDQARPYVLVLENGRAVARTVSTGARGEVQIDGRPEAAVAITEGLSAGAVVLRGTVGALREGTRLQLKTAPGPAPVPSAAAASAAR